jgi:DNA-binding CsgD family transcriptional regulator
MTDARERTVAGLSTIGGVAVLLTRHDLRLHAANLAATELLSDGRVLARNGDKIEPASAVYATFARNLIAKASDEGYRAIAPADDAGVDPRLIFSARRLSGDGDIMLSARSMSLEQPLADKDVMELFGLTQAEARVTVKLSAGMPLPDIAEAHNVNVGTLRAQLRSIYAKVGLSKQPELVAAIWRVASI